MQAKGGRGATVVSYSVLIPGFAALVSAALCGAALLNRMRNRRQALFGLQSLGLTIWSSAYLLSPPGAGMLAGWSFEIGQAGVAITTTFYMLLAAEMTGLDWARRRRTLVAAHLPGTLFALVALSNRWHGQFATWFDRAGVRDFAYGPLGPIALSLVYSLVVIGIALYARAWKRAAPGGATRSAYALMGALGVAPLLSNVLWVLRHQLELTLAFNPTIGVFALGNVAIGLAVLRSGLMDVIPVAESQAFDAMADGAVIIAADGHVLAFNPAAERSLPGIREGLPVEGAGLETLAGVVRSCPPTALETDVEFATGGRTFWARCRRLGEGERDAGLLVIFTDITERNAADSRVRELYEDLRRTVTELEEAMTSRSRFIASMSHELRTPLQSIIGYAGMLDREVAGSLDEEQREHVAVILDTGRHLLTLVEALLGTAKLEIDDMRVEPSEFDLARSGELVVASFLHRAESKDVELVYSCEPTPLVMESDETRVRQILLNLVGNAVKFTSEGTVSLTISGGEGRVSMRVSDTGCGIPANELDMVFEAYYQSPVARRASPSGAGLGLYLTRAVAELLGGEVRLESMVGRGTTVSVRLPIRLHADEESLEAEPLRG